MSFSHETTFTLTLTERERWWMIYLANEELKRLQDLSVADGGSMSDAKKYGRWEPISDVFIKLNQIQPNVANEGEPCQEQ